MAAKLTNDQRIENAIIRRTIKDALKAGYVLSVDDGGEVVLRDSNKIKDIFAAMKSTDEDRLLFRKDGKYVGMVYFVYGNAGYEVINDYSTSIEHIMDPVCEYATSKEY